MMRPLTPQILREIQINFYSDSSYVSISNMTSSTHLGWKANDTVVVLVPNHAKSEVEHIITEKIHFRHVTLKECQQPWTREHSFNYDDGMSVRTTSSLLTEDYTDTTKQIEI